MEKTFSASCNCTLSAIQVLMRIEQLEGSAVGLETSLEVMEDAEVRCLAVLNCTACRQRRFSLASVTVVSATVIEWVQGAWLRGDINNGVSLGSFALDRADADMLSRELMSLQLSHFVKVMAQLDSALSTARSVQVAEYLDIVRAKTHELRSCKQQILGLSDPVTARP
ncbi:hypothetical protein BS50DRAFT_380229 [Corynespora cassiicola Philippines]|uniref:Fungal N-terminal domain-containing protein n=1 Tax=Corynespora cassiicola Philippines TaxID=1448308 RepID=A0A2T2NP22_CORCC|nr:hypothetical protein BS50DRAFT_380229 [Corynespora cassiicola Philippines]